MGLPNKSVDHRSTVRTRIKRATLSFLLRQRQLCWIAKDEIDILPGREREDSRANREMNKSIPHTVALTVFQREANSLLVSIQQVGSLCPLQARDDCKNAGPGA